MDEKGMVNVLGDLKMDLEDTIEKLQDHHSTIDQYIFHNKKPGVKFNREDFSSPKFNEWIRQQADFLAPLYQFLKWEWRNEDKTLSIPNVDKIETLLHTLVNSLLDGFLETDLRDGHSAKRGGLCVEWDTEYWNELREIHLIVGFKWSKFY